MEGKNSSQDRRREGQPPTPQPRVVNEFEVCGRGVSLRMRVERLPAPSDPADDDVPIEAGYGHGV